MKQAVILAGGKGTRLRSVLGDVPKPLAEIGGVPLLGHQLRLLRDHGFDEALLLVDHGADQIKAWADTQSLVDIRVKLIADGAPRGTAGAVVAAFASLAPTFLVMYADTLMDVDLTRFWAWHEAKTDAAASLFLHPNDHPWDSDLVETDANGRILEIHPYPHPAGSWLPNLVNAALYIVRRSALDPWRDVSPPFDFAKNLFPRMLATGMALHGYTSCEYIKDAGTPDRLERVRKAFVAGVPRRTSLTTPQRAVLFDRDGTLNEDKGHIARAEHLEVFDFVGPALKRLNEEGWRTVVVTNQPVVARGEATDADLRRVHARLDTEVARHNAFFDRVYYCPHHPDRGFAGEVVTLKVSCSCRKPEPGLVLRAAHDFNLDLRESWLVGDSSADLGAAENAGMSSIVVETGSGGLDARYPYEVGFSSATMSTAVDFILATYPRLQRAVSPIVDRMNTGEDWFVGGLARSGKSTIAAALKREARRRGLACEIVSLDRWVRSQDVRDAGVFGRYDMSGLENAVRTLKTRAGGQVTLELPAYARMTKQASTGSLSRSFASDCIVIWEGVVACELARRLGEARSVFVEADEDSRRARFLDYYRRRGVSEAHARAIWAERDDDEHPVILASGRDARERFSMDTIFASDTTDRECPA